MPFRTTYSEINHLKYVIKTSLQVIRMYDWLLDFYVLDFFVDSHWSKLPKSWQDCLRHMDPQDLGNILLGIPTIHVLPLSLKALLATIKSLSIDREIKKIIPKHLKGEVSKEFSCGNHPKLENLFLKHVKLKKRHEISVMAEVVAEVGKQSSCNSVIDFGSGLGHLVRVLAYKYEMYAAGIECQPQLTEEASKLDAELEYTAKKHLSSEAMSNLNQPLHLNVKLSSQHQLQDIELPEYFKHYALVGLHPCGDLGPLLLKHFVNCSKVKFICVVGCCYMKLSGGTDGGYPLSQFTKGLNHELSYQSREIACHVIEVYSERLSKGDYKDLKIHAFRAALERILLEHNPKLHHAPVRSIKHSDAMTFQKYCSLALERLHVPLPTSECVWARAHADLSLWKLVVVVYTLRLALAPLVETVVLLDRVLYVLENGLFCEILPVFDPKISPRNHIIIGRRL